MGMESSNGRSQFSIEISEDNQALITSLKQNMEKASYAGCICRVSPEISGENRKAFVPVKVSIGPLHKDLHKNMENHKLRYLYSLLNRSPNEEAGLDSCVQALKELEAKARSYYAEDLNHIISDDFVKLMLIDGGFIIELFLKCSVKGLKRRSDPIFSTPGLLFELRCDMILLENQIPFIVLQRLFQIVPMPKQCNQSLTDLASRFFRNMIPGDYKLTREKFGQEGNHLLDLIRHCFLPTIPRISVKKDAVRHCLPSATQLQEVRGVKLKKARTENLLDIKFVNGVLEIPPLQVHVYTENLLKNLIAFEVLCPCANTQLVTSYVLFMRKLIRSEKDVELLKQAGILRSIEDEYEDEDENKEDDGCDESSTLFRLFESFKKTEVTVKDSYFNELCEQVNGYKAPSWFVWFMKTKGRSNDAHGKKDAAFPFALISVVAVLLVVLIFLGTLFSAMSFFSNH
ncbi:UPF0481 protein At3g47200-like [Mangifera indica]|uniref:UPF0481 protein At3g47200-like n=1 Tax=Mangifera indica TaxID=29780 RepID=UPI001CFBC1D5|nr:UPF0481 protein At3g47200-like [Mangifera indica]